MKKILLYLVIITWGAHSHSQDMGLSFSGGIANYSMDELSLFQQELLTRLPKEAKQFADFPAFTHIEVAFIKKTAKNLRYGLVYAYSSTGSHANYQDFSGYLNLDQRTGAFQLGLFASYPLLAYDFKASQLDLAASGKIRMAYIRNNVLSEINTAYYYESNKVIMSGVSPTVQLGLEGLWHRGNISLGLEGAYLLDAGAKLEFGDQTAFEPSVNLKTSDEIRSNLSGFRAGIKVIFWIDRSMLQE